MPIERPLTEKEKKQLKQMNLSPVAESAVKKVWLEEKPPPRISLGSFVSCVLNPALILILVGSLLNLHPLFTAIKPYAVIAACLAWVCMGVLMGFGTWDFSRELRKNPYFEPFLYGAMILWKKPNKTFYLLMAIALSLFIIIALNDFVAIAITLFALWATMHLNRLRVKKKITRAINKLEISAT